MRAQLHPQQACRVSFAAHATASLGPTKPCRRLRPFPARGARSRVSVPRAADGSNEKRPGSMGLSWDPGHLAATGLARRRPLRSRNDLVGAPWVEVDMTSASAGAAGESVRPGSAQPARASASSPLRSPEKPTGAIRKLMRSASIAAHGCVGSEHGGQTGDQENRRSARVA